jgi:hypothetical protein
MNTRKKVHTWRLSQSSLRLVIEIFFCQGSLQKTEEAEDEEGKIPMRMEIEKDEIEIFCV